ncbi:hypothetical protein [Streptomyces candidus]|uniref:Uncharacterized protein n=1 Tax=Streptomyces candidus TaxID=67283 RepID=A0A7X0HED9_9ACTN|nr:hypothetical protein [Streptomyces candidus]MBB6436097.1 hypothetical protein [Streptomyces candidus]
MTLWKISSVPSVDGWLHADPYRYPGAVTADDDLLPETACDLIAPEDSLLSPPNTAGRPLARLESSDHRRLDLHAALTGAGIAPAPGDAEPIEVRSALDDTTCAVLLRWMHRTW